MTWWRGCRRMRTSSTRYTFNRPSVGGPAAQATFQALGAIRSIAFKGVSPRVAPYEQPRSRLQTDDGSCRHAPPRRLGRSRKSPAACTPGLRLLVRESLPRSSYLHEHLVRARQPVEASDDGRGRNARSSFVL